METTVTAILEQIETYGLKSSAYILCLPGSKSLIQRLDFPFSKRERLKEVLPFELEDKIPVVLSEYSWDFFFAAPPLKEQAKIYATLYPKNEIQEWARLFEQGGVLLDQVALDLTALDKLAKIVSTATGDNLLYLEVDQEICNLVWREGDTIRALRSIPGGLKQGGLQEEKTLEQETGPAEKQVENKAQSPGEENASETAQQEMGRLVREIKRTLYSAGNGESPDGLVLIGKDMELGSLPNLLELETGLVVYLWETLQGFAPQQKQIEPASALAAAAALGWENRKTEFNLNKPPEEGNTLSQWKPHLRFVVAALCLILVSWAVSFGLDLYLQKEKLTQIQTRMEQSFHDILPDAGENVQPVQYASVIRSRIRQAGSSRPLEDRIRVKLSRILESISRGLPPDLELELGLLALDGSTLRISGLAKDFKTVDAIHSRLDSSEIFSEVKIVGANVDQGGEGVSFNLRLKVSSNT